MLQVHKYVPIFYINDDRYGRDRISSSTITPRQGKTSTFSRGVTLTIIKRVVALAITTFHRSATIQVLGTINVDWRFAVARGGAYTRFSSSTGALADLTTTVVFHKAILTVHHAHHLTTSWKKRTKNVHICLIKPWSAK